MLPEDFLLCLACFQNCFTAPSFERFVTLTTRWVLCISKHTVIGVIGAAGVVGKREHAGLHTGGKLSKRVFMDANARSKCRCLTLSGISLAVTVCFVSY